MKWRMLIKNTNNQINWAVTYMEKLGVYVNPMKDKTGAILDGVAEILKECYPKCSVEKIYKDIDLKKCGELDILFVLGGDGTLLGMARQIAHLDVPIVGVNIGNLGFLTTAEIDEFEKVIEMIDEGKYSFEKRMMLNCVVDRHKDKKLYNALNDIVVSKGTLARIMLISIKVNGEEYTTFKADGVIVSTPTGSTAYNLSAGGPIIYPTLDVISITPICPHSLNMRTIILDGDSDIEVKISGIEEAAYTTIDGQEIIEVQDDDIIRITKARDKFRLIRTDDYNYLELLRKKIM